MARTAAALIIGNEILSGKFEEANVHVMAKGFFAMGVELRRVIVCPDEVDVIARDVNELREAHDVVITTGGVGPTHDDVTMEGVAKAFGVGLERNPEYAQILRDYHGDGTTEMHLRMADVPEGSRLVNTPELNWPTVARDNVYVFPGVPEIFKAKFRAMREEFQPEGQFYSRAVYVHSDEAELAPLLDRLNEDHGQVNIGSYVRWGEKTYRTKLTIDGRDEAAVVACFDAMVAGIPDKQLVRTE